MMENDIFTMNKSNIPSNYNESSPISINGNSDFASKAAANLWSGNGTISNPYVISNLNITSTSNITILMSVVHTDVHFRIESSLFVGGYTGVRFENVTHGFVFNNSIQDCSFYGSLVSGSNLIRFENNTIKDIHENGLSLYWIESDNSTIEYNSFEGGCEK